MMQVKQFEINSEAKEEELNKWLKSIDEVKDIKYRTVVDSNSCIRRFVLVVYKI